jgi:glycosyltransferase involved in cell wall biosynthesis
VVRITLIIATRNACDYIEETLQSIIMQEHKDIQLIIVDSQSDDGTLEILKKYTDAIDVLISEPDDGIYDAWNKGCKYIEGEWVHFLGAGDVLPSKDTYKNVVPYLVTAYPKHEMVYGDLELILPITKKVVEKISIPYEHMKNKWVTARPLTPVHPEVFAHYSLFKVLPFDKKYKMAGDLKFMLQSMRRRNPLHINVLVDKMLLGGLSSDIRYLELAELEKKMVISELGILVPKSEILLYRIKFNAKLSILKYFPVGYLKIITNIYRKMMMKNSYD